MERRTYFCKELIKVMGADLMKLDELRTEIGKLTDSVRSHINTHRYQTILLADSQAWNQICSSLDVIEDSLYAVISYSAADFPEDTGLQYIYTYGLLQALFLMQDALTHLSEAFGLPLALTDALKEIRDIRNSSIGHPTKQIRKGRRYYNYISRISMGKAGFDLMQSTGDGSHTFKRIDLTTLCLYQLQEIVVSYQKIVERLEEIDRMHREKFRENILTDLFHSALGYYFEKVGQGITAHSYEDRQFGHTHVGLLRKVYEKFKDALLERNELHEYTEFDINEYFHALNKLDEYLSGTRSSMEEADARIYLSYLRHEHERFVALAKEIDASYRNDGSDLHG